MFVSPILLNLEKVFLCVTSYLQNQYVYAKITLCYMFNSRRYGNSRTELIKLLFKM